MYKPSYLKREPIVFHHFIRKGYALFACLGREVIISVLSVATLSASKAASISDEVWRVDSTKATKEVWLDDIGVMGSRAPLTKRQAVRMVSVLSREDIQAAPVQSVNDLLKMAVGVDVRQRGTLGSQTDISVRGGTQEQITILLNGVNICDPQTAHNVMDLPVDLSEIVRIEVLEGPSGRVYGTSSLVGAINIVTHPEPVSSMTVGIEGGSFGYMKANGRINKKSSRWNHQASGSYMRSDGFSRARSGSLNTDFSGSKAFYQGSYDDEDVAVYWHLGISDKGWGSSTFYASPKWQADDQYEHTTKIFSAIQGETKRGKLHFRPMMYWNQNRDRYEGYRSRTDKMPYNYNRCDVYGVGLNSYFDWLAGRTAFGAELRNEDLISTNLGEKLFNLHPVSGTDRNYTMGINRTNMSAHLEHNVLLDKLTISAGMVAMRSTQSSMNWQVYPGIDVSWRLSENWKLYAGYNSSLRLPTFTEMYYKLQGYAADSHLKPEKMQAVEIGTQYVSDGFQTKVSAYHHHGSNMIDWIMDVSQGNNSEWKSVNHTIVNSYGLEINTELELLKIIPVQRLFRKFSMSYGYIHQSKEDTPNFISQYALEYLRHKLLIQTQLSVYKCLNADVSWRWQDRVGLYTDFSGIVNRYRPYGLLDFRLYWNKPQYSIYMDVNNALNNRDYVDYGNVPQPGLLIELGAKINMRL